MAAAVAAALGGGPVGHREIAAATADPATDLSGLPLSFEPNRGQARRGVDFVARTGAGSFVLGPSGAQVALAGSARRHASVSLSLPGAAPGEPLALSRLPGTVNYLVGRNPTEWHRGIPTFARVRYPSAWPGIDVDWHGDGKRLEYDFRLAPGADPTAIRLRIGGATDIRLEPDGDLSISAPGGTMRERAPVAFQESASGRQAVPVSYAVEGRTVGLRLGSYDSSRPLLIDPVVLAYSTYLGGNDTDSATGVAVDGSGAAYVVGTTLSTDFNLVNQLEGDATVGDVFISKLNPAGNALVYSTYLGGNKDDEGNGIAVDPSAAAYVIGTTNSTDFNVDNPLPTGGSLSGGSNLDAFVTKLTPAGNDTVYSTYLGGTNNDFGKAIAVDSTGAAYVTGIATGSVANFPLQNPIQATLASNDAFISKLVPAGNSLAYSTYLGGSGNDEGHGIAVDSSHAVYVTGLTGSITSGVNPFPTVNPYETDPGDGQDDAFVTKVNPAGSAFTYSTLLGGDAGDIGNGIAVDGSGAAYVTGQTPSTDFPSSNPIQANQPDSDAFVTKLLPTGNALGYSTYLGGDGYDAGAGIAVTPSGAVHVTGTTLSSNFPTVNGFPGGSTESGGDPFVSQLTPAGNTLAFSSLLHGSGDDSGAAIAVDSDGDDWLVGVTASSDFPTLGPIEGDSPNSDAFVTKLSAPPAQSTPSTPAPPPGACTGRTATITGTDGPDVITGTPGPDVIAGLGGDDRISGLSGADLICGGAGRDRISGGKGKDRLLGEAGKDRLAGGKGKDKLVGGSGKDKLLGGQGDDKLKGGPGKDRLSGGAGKDKLKGGGGKDTCTGGPSKDAAGGCELRRSI